MAYAAFGTPNTDHDPDFEVTEGYMYDLGRSAKSRNLKNFPKAKKRKLPRFVQISGRQGKFPIVGSRHAWAQAFVRGWNDVKSL